MCFVDGNKTEISVDSGAEENVCPRHWGSQFGSQQADRWMNFRSASGGEFADYGKRNVRVSAATF